MTAATPLLFGPRPTRGGPLAVEARADLTGLDEKGILARFIDLPAPVHTEPVDDRGKRLHLVHKLPLLTRAEATMQHYIGVVVTPISQPSRQTRPKAHFATSFLHSKPDEIEPYFLGKDFWLASSVRNFNKSRQLMLHDGWQGTALVSEAEVLESVARYLGRFQGEVQFQATP
jgi:hypothetical protein